MEKGGGSRLLQMQARFQQKQMQEREMKIASLYEAQQTRALDKVRHSPSSNGHVTNGHSSVGSTPPAQAPVSHQPGKVRQMFEERRTKGIDKSYPLQPIHNTERARRPLPNGYSKVSTTTTTKASLEKRATRHTTTSHSVKTVTHHKTENILNGSGDLNHNHEPDLNSLKHALPQKNGDLIATDEIDNEPDKDNNYLLEDETFPEALAPIPTPRSPEPAPQAAPVRKDVKAPPRRSPPKSPAKTKSQTAAAPPRRVISENAVSEPSKPRGAMQKVVQPKSQPAVVKSSPRGAPKTRPAPSGSGVSAAGAGAGAGSGDACAVCGRRFAPDRLAKHQDICKKAHAKKRKPFDVLKHRLAGTEAEPFISKLRKGASNNPSTNKASSKPLNSNWRQKHEEFINAIRAAKQVQAHLQAGGKLSDLPPPPPSENPDYVKCPSCGRRFNQAAADRHIPKCKDFQFNKPKPTGSKRR